MRGWLIQGGLRISFLSQIGLMLSDGKRCYIQKCELLNLAAPASGGRPSQNPFQYRRLRLRPGRLRLPFMFRLRRRAQMPLTGGITTIAAETSPETAADLASAFAAGAELLLVITGDGREQVYLRGRDRMALVRDEMASYEVGSPTLDESIALAIKSAEEAGRYREDPPELVFRQAGPGQLEDDVYAPAGLTPRQAAVAVRGLYEFYFKFPWGTVPMDQSTYDHHLSEWKSPWLEDPRTWPEYLELQKLIPMIDTVVPPWIHPASGMSSDDVKLLILAHFRQEGHYRREIGHNIVDVVGNAAKNVVSRGLKGDPSIGPSNLRPTVADEMLRQKPGIPMSIGPAVDFDDMGLLNSLQSAWPDLDSGQREALLEDDETAIRLTAANIFRGVERLLRTYLYRELNLKSDDEIQRHLNEGGIKRGDLIERYLQQETYRASMFNMLAWLSQGIAESDTLLESESGAANNARLHASGAVRSSSAIASTGAFGFPTAWGYFRMYNNDELFACRDA